MSDDGSDFCRFLRQNMQPDDKRSGAGQEGSALMLVAVILGVVSVLTLLLFATPDSENQIQKQTLAQERFQSLVTAMGNQLSDPVFCAGALFNQPVVPGSTYPISVNMSYAGQSGPITAGWRMGGAGSNTPLVANVLMKVSSGPPYATVQLDKGIPGPGVNGPPALTLQKYYARIYVNPNLTDPWSPHSWNNSDAFPTVPPASGDYFNQAKNPQRVIDLRLQAYVLGVTRSVYGCFASNSPAEICDEMGGAYDSQQKETNAKYRCNPGQNKCWNDGRGAIYLPSALPPPPTVAGCKYPYIQEWIGTFGANQVFLCNWCNGAYQSAPYRPYP